MVQAMYHVDGFLKLTKLIRDSSCTLLHGTVGSSICRVISAYLSYLHIR